MSELRGDELPGSDPRDRDAQKPGGDDVSEHSPDASSKIVVAAWRPTTAELKQILARHLGWRANPHPDEPHFFRSPLADRDEYLEREPACPDWRNEALTRPEKANLSHAVLSDDDLFGVVPSVDLRGATLIRADLSNAILRVANLENVDLNNADLSNADLSNARLRCADLRGTNLSRAKLLRAILSDADLRGANLREVNLRYANLRNAQICGDAIGETDVTGAILAHADLTHAIYAPASEAPNPYVVGIRGLSTVQIPPGQQEGLVQLRKLLQDAGLRDLEREATYSIERTRNAERFGIPQTSATPPGVESARRFSVAAALEGAFRMVLFDWTTAYGLHPGRAIRLIVLMVLLCAPIYAWSIVNDPGKPLQPSGIYQILPKDRIDESMTGPMLAQGGRVVLVHDVIWYSAFEKGLYFSLLSVTNIGFQQFTPGDWIRRLQSQDYSLQGVGWVRRVAGAQALLGLYLLAIWVLTYFGRPFQ